METESSLSCSQESATCFFTSHRQINYSYSIKWRYRSCSSVCNSSHAPITWSAFTFE